MPNPNRPKVAQETAEACGPYQIRELQLQWEIEKLNAEIRSQKEELLTLYRTLSGRDTLRGTE